MDTKLKGFERERVEKKLNYANNTQQVQAPDFALTSGKMKTSWHLINIFGKEKTNSRMRNTKTLQNY